MIRTQTPWNSLSVFPFEPASTHHAASAPAPGSHHGTHAGLRHGGQSQLRQNHALQRADRPSPEGGQLSGCDRGEKNRHDLLPARQTDPGHRSARCVFPRSPFARRSCAARRALRAPRRHTAARPHHLRGRRGQSRAQSLPRPPDPRSRPAGHRGAEHDGCRGGRRLEN